ncbi:MAG: glutamate racemase [Firmicutes bacterium]|jgi:glutamate racemase|nr:glutamate racemase [Bacillota bacterium]MBR3748350.1 glutamate racemase [Bacillota bacterium]MBR4143004.1 glutamate racemase [Bacillota bacterium]
MSSKVAVMAGTPVDTKMGADFLAAKDASLEIVSYPLSPDPITQTVWQFSSDENKRARMVQVFDELEAQGIRHFFIYCNSLSGAFDFDRFAVERGVCIVTPFQVYRSLATRYRSIAFNSANLLGAYGIEKAFRDVKPDLDVIGMAHLAIVRDIEAGLAPEEIIERQGLKSLARFFKEAGAEIWLLGCTHFPYIKEAMQPYSELPLIDPADEMYDLLVRGMRE